MSGKKNSIFKDTYLRYYYLDMISGFVDVIFKGRFCDKKDYLERDEARLPLPENHVAT